jgi:serine/threonine protein kinase
VHKAIISSEPELPLSLSPDCANFISLCLSKDACRRPSALALSQHPWIARFADAAASSVDVAPEAKKDPSGVKHGGASIPQPHADTPAQSLPVHLIQPSDGQVVCCALDAASQPAESSSARASQALAAQHEESRSSCSNIMPNLVAMQQSNTAMPSVVEMPLCVVPPQVGTAAAANCTSAVINLRNKRSEYELTSDMKVRESGVAKDVMMADEERLSESADDMIRARYE